jgi:hypothetical protein
VALRTGIVGLVVALLGCATFPVRAQTSSTFDENYQQQYKQWQATLDQERREQWLTLAGLFWLRVGENPFGSATNNAIVFPPKSSAHAGVLMLAGKNVMVRFAPDVQARVNGTLSASARLDADITGHPSVVDLGQGLRFEVVQRGERTGIRLWDMDRPEAREYRGAIFFPLVPKYRVTAVWVPYERPKMIRVPNVLGDSNEMPAPGEVEAQVAGKAIHLVAVSGDPAKGFFLVFSDPTRKSETYPAGRFLQTGPVQDGKVALDFNYAYNPPCALTPFATCPLPPEQNQLAVPIPAGEKYDRSHGNPHR